MNISILGTAPVSFHSAQASADVPASRASGPVPADGRIMDTPQGARTELSIYNPTLALIHAAAEVHDPRAVQIDQSPRGVEIDRMEMVRQGFEHLHDLIEKISGNPRQSPASDQSSMDLKL